MKEDVIEGRIFVALVCAGVTGLSLRIWACNDVPASLLNLITPICSDVLLYFGSVGCVGLLCLKIFGPSQVQRTHAWVFFAAVVAAAILVVCNG
jgi:hypothetical protein